MVDHQIYPYQGGNTGAAKPPKGVNSKKNTKDSDIVPEVEDDLQNGPIFNRHCTDIL
jgi:hypothetical protein